MVTSYVSKVELERLALQQIEAFPVANRQFPWKSRSKRIRVRSSVGTGDCTSTPAKMRI